VSKPDNIIKKKQVSIAIHSTAQTKYWNNKTGWQEVVDYLKSINYEVIILSKENDGYMGNSNPIGAIKMEEGPIENVMKTLLESELFIGISSGLSWLSWSLDVPTIIISGFTDESLEPSDVIRVINKDVCNGCWSKYKFNPGDWNWCPVNKGTDKQFECSKSITGEMVIEKIKDIIEKNPL
jgi:autotransporter strand-loop-strand O-heptosyltransferase